MAMLFKYHRNRVAPTPAEPGVEVKFTQVELEQRAKDEAAEIAKLEAEVAATKAEQEAAA